MSILYLAKKNDNFISHCQCKNALVGSPDQLACPDCGCGWLFSCSRCRKAFSFAEAIEIEKSWDEIAKEDLKGYSKENPTQEMVSAWIDDMQHMLSQIELGKTYVYLDGCFIPAEDENIQFDGLYAKHDFPRVPHLMALEDSKIADNILSNPEYWNENKI